MAKPGKRLRVKNTAKIPRTTLGTFSSTANSKRIVNNDNLSLKGRSPLPTSNTAKVMGGYKSNSDAFGIWLRKNAITTLSGNISTTGSITQIDIRPVSNFGGGDYLLRKGDTFYIYDQFSYKNKQLTADADLLHGDVRITITSTSFIKGTDMFRDGAFIIFDNKTLVERVSNSILYKKYTLTNAEYKALRTSPYTLLAAETNKIHLPISCYIQYKHGADEMTRGSLYIGHNSPSTTLGNYWGGIVDFVYRERNDLLYQIGASTYASPGFSTGYPLKSDGDDGTGSALTLYTSSSFTSPTSYIILHLYYKTI